MRDAETEENNLKLELLIKLEGLRLRYPHGVPGRTAPHFSLEDPIPLIKLHYETLKLEVRELEYTELVKKLRIAINLLHESS